MRLDELAGAIGLTAASLGDDAAILIHALALDSRTVHPGTLFAALPGNRIDGRAFIGDAVTRGAAAILAEAGTVWPDRVPPRPLLLHPQPARALALLAAAHAGPQPERIVAITGTNGKTSTAEFLRQLWQLSGVNAASLGTLGVISPIRLRADGPPLTTPDSIALARLLAELAQGDVRAASIEASSHGLSQYRLDGLRLRTACFSNLTRDHLDYHRTLELYRRAKLRLFSELLPVGGLACANADMDPATLQALRAVTSTRRQTLRLAGASRDADLRVIRARPLPDGQVVELEALGRTHRIMLGLPGRFQLDNVVLAAISAEYDLSELDRVLPLTAQLTGVRGRMERAARLDDGAVAYVDYAHTPDALERLLHSLRPHALGRLVVVFGAGGDRDRGKRPLMGAVAQRLADIAIVTDDNPRSEAPEAIRAEILAACPDAIEIGDRSAAIAAGLDAIRGGDVLVIAGKGHEQGQTIGAETLPFDDRAMVRKLAGITEQAA